MLNISRQEISTTGEVLSQDGLTTEGTIFVEDGSGVKSGLKLGVSLAEAVDPTTDMGIVNVRYGDRTYAKVRDLRIFTTAIASAQSALSEATSTSISNLETAFQLLEDDINSLEENLQSNISNEREKIQELTINQNSLSDKLSSQETGLETLKSRVSALETKTSDSTAAAAAVSGNTSIVTTFTQAGTGAVQRTVESKLRDIVSVLDFIPEGTDTANTDCTEWIQAAIDYAASLVTNTGLVQSTTVYFPPGRYEITDQITIPNGKSVSLEGAGPRSSVIWVNPGTYANGAAFVFAELGSTTFGNCVRNLGFRRNATTSGTLDFAHLYDLGSFNFENLWISGFYKCFRIEGCSRGFMTKVSVDAAGRSAAQGKAYAVWHFVEGNTGIHLTDCEVTSQNSTLAGQTTDDLGIGTATNASWIYIILNNEIDSLYCNNCHWIDYDIGYNCDIKSNHITGTIVFTQCYWDAYRVNCVNFVNNINQVNYDINTHRWVQCYLRAGEDTIATARSVNVDTTQEIDLLQFSNCVFKGSGDVAIFIRNTGSQVLNLQVVGNYFEQNNRNSTNSLANNIVGWAKQLVVSNNIFHQASTAYVTGSGATNGYSVNIYIGSGLSYNLSGNHTTAPAASAPDATAQSEDLLNVNGGGTASATNSGNKTSNNTWTVY